MEGSVDRTLSGCSQVGNRDTASVALTPPSSDDRSSRTWVVLRQARLLVWASSIDVDARVTPLDPPRATRKRPHRSSASRRSRLFSDASLCLDKEQSLATRPARRSNSQPSLSRDTAAAWGTRPSADDEERCYPRDSTAGRRPRRSTAAAAFAWKGKSPSRNRLRRGAAAPARFCPNGDTCSPSSTRITTCRRSSPLSAVGGALREHRPPDVGALLGHERVPVPPVRRPPCSPRIAGGRPSLLSARSRRSLLPCCGGTRSSRGRTSVDAPTSSRGSSLATRRASPVGSRGPALRGQRGTEAPEVEARCPTRPQSPAGRAKRVRARRRRDTRASRRAGPRQPL